MNPVLLQRSANVLAIGIILALTGCERKEPTATEITPTTTPPGISREAAGNAAFASEYTATGVIRLTDGRYQDSDLVSSELDPLAARGDIDGDGVEDMAVLLVTNTGGSGIFQEVYVLQQSKAAPANTITTSMPAFLGDRVVVNGLRIEPGKVIVDLIVQGDNDPLCCPTKPVTSRFRLDNNRLVRITNP